MNAFLTVRGESIGKAAKEYAVDLYQAPDDETWIAESDALPIATEGPTIDSVMDRVWQIAPEIAELNGHKGPLNLRFVVHTRARA